MGDIGSGDASGAVMAERPACDNPDPASISKENWTVAEGITWEVVNDVHPTLDSEERRNNVIDYVQRLLKSSLGFEVFGFGSVPLKTYLPDGDIDLTILSSSGAEASWAADVLSVLQREEKNECAEFQVKDTQFIDAEVKLVKCLVQNIVIDISFNQFGGLCTLCFLEQVDRLVGNHHLFKRSIILIKAWCYYESRILGAHHGLLSTYALETLVLYIFHLFHSSLDGPLAVLYQFLDYFSKFDWENYCISLKGPVCKSSLPEIVAQMPVKEGNRLMLSEEFLRNCMEMFSMPSLGPETNSRVFSPKHLNIIDPLKEYNNLGRSVHRGNFFRIRSAFRYGARKLGRVLSLPEDKIADEIKNFFCNTLRRHESKFGSSTPDYASVLNGRGPVTFLSSSQPAVLYEDRMHLISSGTDSDNDGHFMEERQNSIHSAIYSWRVASSPTMPGLNHSVEPLSGYHLNGDACDFVRHNYVDFRTSNSTSDCSPSSNPSVASLGQFCHVPLLFLPNSSPRNGYPSQVHTCDGIEERLGPETWPEHRDENMEMANIFQSCSDSLDGYSSCYSAVSSPKSNISESLSLDFREGDLLSADDTEPLNPLADLRGDYDSHIRSLLHGPFFHKLALLEHVLQHPPLSPSLSHFQIKNPWHTVHPSMSLEQHSFSQTNWSNISVSQPASSLAPCISAFASEENQKARGTGTYFPVMNNYCQDGPSQGWNSRPLSSGMHGQSPRHNTHGNGYNPTYSEMPNSAKGGREVAQAWCPVQDKKKSGSSSQSECSQECRNCADGFSNSSQRIEFGSIGHLVDEVISASRSSCALASNNHHLKASSGFEKAEKKVADEPFGLKNEDEFPPLSI